MLSAFPILIQHSKANMKLPPDQCYTYQQYYNKYNNYYGTSTTLCFETPMNIIQLLGYEYSKIETEYS